MKASRFLKTMSMMLAAILIFQFAAAQKIQNWRPYDQRGVNVFEPAKDVDTEFKGLKVRVGGSFTQQMQALSHSNDADFKAIEYRGNEVNGNELYAIAPGFNLATANLFIDAQLADGIRVSLENYMASRHHTDFWVKGGYIQIDKLSMFKGNTDWFDNNLRVKIGHFGVNYGDQQFRRSDNGNTMYNPFVGNYIMDAFATEIGGELYYFNPSGLMLMAGVTTGSINGVIQENPNRAPSIYAKAAFDKDVNEDVRVRLSASYYMNNGTVRNTLYAGDRTGSRFYMAMEPAYYKPRGATAYSTSSTDGLFTSGRLNGGFATEVQSVMINPFVKLYGLEIFGTYENARGLASYDFKGDGMTEPDARTINQFAIEGIYRFLKNEQLYIGGRYNKMTGELNSYWRDADGAIVSGSDRIEVVAGWYPIKNLLLKGSYINQNYLDFPSSDHRHEGNFNGFMIEAAVGF